MPYDEFSKGPLRARSQGTDRTGWTAVELLVVIVVIAVLVSLTVPALAGARRTAKRVKCVANARQTHMSLLSYTADFRDTFPSWQPLPPEGSGGTDAMIPYASQFLTVFTRDAWSEYTGASLADGARACPGNQFLGLPGVLPSSDYALTIAAWIDPAYLNPLATLSSFGSRTGASVQRLSDCAFPSRKIGVYEWRVWHDWKDVYRADVDGYYLLIDTTPNPGAAAMLDGSASLRNAQVAMPPVKRWPVWPMGSYSTIAWGIQGFDFN